MDLSHHVSDMKITFLKYNFFIPFMISKCLAYISYIFTSGFKKQKCYNFIDLKNNCVFIILTVIIKISVKVT